MQDLRRNHTTYDLYGESPHPGSSYGVRSYTPVHGAPAAISRPPSRAPSTNSGRHCTPLTRPKTRQSLVTDNGTQTQDTEDRHPYSGSMDPVNRHYYFREWCQNPPKPQMPLNRSGRMGSSWRHVKTTFNPHGGHMAFIDGIVKEEENYFYPPDLMYKTPDFSQIVPGRRCITPAPFHTSPKQSKNRTSYNNKAKEGFKYWYQEPKPLNLSDRYRLKGKWLHLGL